MGVVADDEIGSGVDRGPRRGHLRLARLLDVFIATVQNDDHQIDLRSDGGYVGADTRRVGPGQAGRFGRRRPALRIEIGYRLYRHIDITEKGHLQAVDLGDVGCVGGRLVCAAADRRHAGSVEQVDALQQRFGSIILSVVVGQ